ncbi:type II toxin-antitoxin system RelE/ParE family toxin [Sphingomonas sp. BT-65]|uniref:type II toxin-antitoxin system RelE/ParE family toxin n=1 Tax=Sphingomonas sp. BT-65 TaxID=2989821 RepID=UPI0022364FCB|nr:type II toxin-antitoxin system RelE/ParE family toxin [Sphingomonas sp. BT-65]MCW4462198.1 type II toxin-antitoxin system RelE/ParE family toxin [Sphingomonas sp. BT-65]
MVRVELSNEAFVDLDEIASYSIAMFGVDVADAYVSELHKAFALLSEFPELGVLVAELKRRPRCLPCGRHRIFYRYEDDIVLVIRVLHHAMDPRQWLD